MEGGVSSSCAHARLWFFLFFSEAHMISLLFCLSKGRWLSWTGGYAVLMSCGLFNKNLKRTLSRIQRLWRTSGGLYNFPGKAVGALGQNPYVFHVVAHSGSCTTDMLIMFSHIFTVWESTFRKCRNRERIKHRQISRGLLNYASAVPKFHTNCDGPRVLQGSTEQLQGDSPI